MTSPKESLPEVVVREIDAQVYALCGDNSTLSGRAKQRFLRIALLAFTEGRRMGLEEGAKCLPDTWLDDLLSGENAVVKDSPCPEIERLTEAYRSRIRALAGGEGRS